jgi:DNA-binding transcriptional MerR regulator
VPARAPARRPWHHSPGGPWRTRWIRSRCGTRPNPVDQPDTAQRLEESRARRDPKTGYRVYSAADVRDALLVHQLRRGGYLLEQIAPLIAQVRSAGGVAPLESTLADWHARLSARSHAMLTGAAALEAYLSSQPACRDRRTATAS